MVAPFFVSFENFLKKCHKCFFVCKMCFNIASTMTTTMKDTTLITKEDWAMFPKVFTTRYFHNDDDKRDIWNEIYALENVVNNIDEERQFFQSVNHEANLVIEVKFANGKIK